MLVRIRFISALTMGLLLMHPAAAIADNQTNSTGTQLGWEQFDLATADSADRAADTNSPNAGGEGGPGSSGATGEQSHSSSSQGYHLRNAPAGAKPSFPQTFFGGVANGSVNLAPVSSGAFNFGFTGGGAPSSAKSIMLPPTSTSSCDFNIVDP